jgi:hypothetical protein
MRHSQAGLNHIREDEMAAGLGLEVARMIPKNTMLGLLSGAYKLHGGVVRDMGGRIVAHMAIPSTVVSLVPGLGWVAEAFQTYQLHEMGLVLNRVETQIGSLVKLTTATAAMSGLGVVVSVAGFALLYKQLGKLSETLNRIERNTKKTNSILEAVQYGKLQAAIDAYRRASETTDQSLRQSLLQTSQHDFNQLVHEYKQCWGKFQDLMEMQVLDDGYTLAMIGQGLALSDLGMTEAAAKEFGAHRLEWQHLARSHCRTDLLRTDPQRLLHHRYLHCLPAADLVRLLDFVEQADRGVGWLDELRQREAAAPVLRMPALASKDAEIEFAMRLVAKDDVLQGYEGHLQFLHEHGMRACDFQRQVIEQSQGDSGYEGPLWVTVAGAHSPETAGTGTGANALSDRRLQGAGSDAAPSDPLVGKLRRLLGRPFASRQS